jgi:hypothetical protein
MHRSTLDKTQRLEGSKFVEPQYHIEEISKSKPIFVQPLSDPKPVNEGKNIHLECRLEPMGDPTMRVEWFCNGRPVTVGKLKGVYYRNWFCNPQRMGVLWYDITEPVGQ